MRKEQRADDLMLIQFQTIELPHIHHLLSYWPIEENNEPNTHLFNDYIEFKNPAIKFLYPKTDFEKTGDGGHRSKCRYGVSEERLEYS